MSLLITQGYGASSSPSPPPSPPIPVWPAAGIDRLSGILLAVQAQLQNALSWPRERVLIVDPAKLKFHPQGDAYLCLWPDTDFADVGVYLGAGRIDFRMARKLFVNLRTRTILDEPETSTAWMTDQTLGHGVAELSVWNALVEYFPVDAKGNQLSINALKPINGGRPKLDPKENEWGESALAFEVIYAPAIAVPPF